KPVDPCSVCLFTCGRGTIATCGHSGTTASSLITSIRASLGNVPSFASASCSLHPLAEETSWSVVRGHSPSTLFQRGEPDAFLQLPVALWKQLSPFAATSGRQAQ